MLILLQIWCAVAAMTKLTQNHILEIAHLMRDERDHGRPFSFLTGSGCSKPAGIPTAHEIVAELCSGPLRENIKFKFGGKTPKGKDYGDVMSILTPNQRKDYFTKILEKPKINIGHIALASMMKAGYVSRLVTFNFDSVFVRAASMLGLFPAVYDFGLSPATTFDHIAEKSVLHLHGQGFGQVMKNTAKETTDHARALRLLFDNTLAKSGLIVVGYSGEADAAFPEFKNSCCQNVGNPLYWCNFEDRTEPNHIADLLTSRTEHKSYLQDVNFDVFAVQLARELRCFDVELLHKPARHLLNILEPIVPPPEDLPGVQKTLEDVRAKLESWNASDIKTPSELLNEAMLAGDWAAAIALKDQCTLPQDIDQIAGAYSMQGNDLAELAKLENDEALFNDSFAKYDAAMKLRPDWPEPLYNWGIALLELAMLKSDESLFRDCFAKFDAAVKLKPDFYEALYNWGNALSDLAKIKNDETLFRESFAKYEAALKLKPDMHEALNNWGTALSYLAKAKNDEALFRESFAKYDAALKIKPDSHEALNNWGKALSDLAKIKHDEALFRNSFMKFDGALKLKPDWYEPLYNWGNALVELAMIKDDEGLFRDSFVKYGLAVKLKPDRHEPLYNWGTALLGLAKLKNDEALFRESFVKFCATVKLKPDRHEPFYNWGIALLELAKLKNEEMLFRESFEKFDAALKLKPDLHKAMNSWGTALVELGKIKNDDALFRDGFVKYDAALKIKPNSLETMENLIVSLRLLYALNNDIKLLAKAENLCLQVQKLSKKASYNLACLYGRQDRENDCEAQLLLCKADGTLPSIEHLRSDEDIEPYREKDWFKALVAG